MRVREAARARVPSRALAACAIALVLAALPTQPARAGCALLALFLCSEAPS